MVELDLGSALGLATNQKDSFGGMPLTRFANQELAINQNKDRLAAEQKKKQAELEKELMGKISVTGKFDKISQPKIQKAVVDLVTSGNYKNPNALIEFNLLKQREELASSERDEIVNFYDKNQVLAPSQVVKAFKDRDVKTLAELAKDPANMIEKDPDIEDSYRPTTVGRFLKDENINKKAKEFVPTDDANIDYRNAARKVMGQAGDKIIYGYPVKENVLTDSAIQFAASPERTANWVEVHGKEIEGLMKGGLTMEQALIKNFKDKNRYVERITDEPYRERKKSGVFIDVDGSLVPSGSNGWKLTPIKNDPSSFLIGTVGTGSVAPQLVPVRKLAAQEKLTGDLKTLTQNTPIQQETITPTKFTNMGKYGWLVEAKDADKQDVKVVMSNETAQSMLTGDLERAALAKSKPGKMVSVKEYLEGKQPSQKPQQSTGKKVKISTIKSKIGTSGFEGYSEKELVDYYKSQGYTVE